MQTVLLVLAISVDVFLASVACGTEQIKIEKKAALCIGAICSGVLFFALAAGKLLGHMIPEHYADVLCFTVMFLLGGYKLVEYGIRVYIRKYKFICKRVKITFSQLNFILSIYNNPVMADRDQSKVMSVTEGIFFALAMSMDGLFAGFGAAFMEINICVAALLGFVVSIMAVLAGCWLGGRAVQHRKVDLSWLGGALFIVLAFGKIL